MESAAELMAAGRAKHKAKDLAGAAEAYASAAEASEGRGDTGQAALATALLGAVQVQRTEWQPGFRRQFRCVHHPLHTRVLYIGLPPTHCSGCVLASRSR